jgi:hypothetical protein
MNTMIHTVHTNIHTSIEIIRTIFPHTQMQEFPDPPRFTFTTPPNRNLTLIIDINQNIKTQRMYTYYSRH